MSTSLRIPARFIQTWKSRALPARYEDNVTRLRDLHPDFEYFFFTDEECLQFVETEYPQYASIYKSFENTIQRVDFLDPALEVRVQAARSLGQIEPAAASALPALRTIQAPIGVRISGPSNTGGRQWIGTPIS